MNAVHLYWPLFYILVLLGITKEKMCIMIIYNTKIVSPGLLKSIGGCILPGRGIEVE